MDHRLAGTAPTSWRAHVATAVTTGEVTTYLPVQRWSRPARWALHGGTATLAGSTMALALRRPQTLRRLGVRSDSDEPVALLPTAVIAGAFGALLLGASRGGQAGDEWVERRLTARGVRRPVRRRSPTPPLTRGHRPGDRSSCEPATSSRPSWSSPAWSPTSSCG